MFRPSDNTPVELTFASEVARKQFQDFTEFKLRVKDLDWISLDVRIFDGKKGEVEVEWQVGPIEGNENDDDVVAGCC